MSGTATTSRAESRTGVRLDASMSLLREAMENPLDPGYALAAERRARGEQPRGARRVVRDAVVLGATIAIGLGAVWAARDLRAVPPGPTARAVLVEEIAERTEDGAALAAENAELREEVQALQEAAFGDVAAEAFAEGQQLGIWAGTTAVEGPGLVVSISDSARAQAGDPGAEDQRVQDYDLQVVVNGLWAAGAESVAVNGIRLTGATAIRAAGSTVLVDLQPLASPYTIEAIGDPEEMRNAFARTDAASYLAWLSAEHGIESELVVADDLVLAAGTPADLSTQDDGDD